MPTARSKEAEVVIKFSYALFMETAAVEKAIIYRKSRHFEEEPLMVDEQSARASISAWKRDVDGAIKTLREGGKVSTPNFNFYGVPA